MPAECRRGRKKDRGACRVPSRSSGSHPSLEPKDACLMGRRGQARIVALAEYPLVVLDPFPSLEPSSDVCKIAEEAKRNRGACQVPTCSSGSLFLFKPKKIEVKKIGTPAEYPLVVLESLLHPASRCLLYHDSSVGERTNQRR